MVPTMDADGAGGPTSVGQSKSGGSERTVILKSAAHLCNMEQPEEFTRAITAFLARVG